MKSHLQYLSYVLRHKWFVFVAGVKIKAPLWRLLIHDWTKLLPSEWVPYVDFFCGEKITDEQLMERWRREQVVLGYRLTPSNSNRRDAFSKAWNHHQKRNKHHWQYWVLINDKDEPKISALAMPEKFIREMVADWAGAGRAITGKWEVSSWYFNNQRQMILHPATRQRVETLLKEGKS